MKKMLLVMSFILFVNVAAVAISETVTLYPTDDAKIDEFASSHNYGAAKSLEVRNGQGMFGGGWEIDSILKFDLSSIPKDATIKSAELNVYYYKWKDNDPAARDLSLYEIKSNWNENTVTWNTRPEYGDKIAHAAIPSTTGKWMTWDVKDSVKSILNGKEVYGWAIKDENAWGSVNIPYAFFYSKENTDHKPYLTITYELLQKEKKEKKGTPGMEIITLSLAMLISIAIRKFH